MTTFRIGQRVRIVGADYFGPESHPAGLEAAITEGPGGFIGPLSGLGYTWAVTTTDGREIYANSSDLEPLTDANTLVSWESMRDLWVPEHLREAA